MKHSDDPSAHRLFAAIVLMGTSLGVGCGGVTDSDRRDESSGENGSSGGSGGSGSSSSSGSGGVIVPHLDVGGTSAGPQPIKPGPFACPPEQWSCASQECGLVGSGWALPSACACDPQRPRRASDCPPDQAFICQEVTSSADGQPFNEPVALSCSCVEKSMYFCSNECDAVYKRSDLDCRVGEDQRSALCGCAIIYLK